MKNTVKPKAPSGENAVPARKSKEDALAARLRENLRRRKQPQTEGGR